VTALHRIAKAPDGQAVLSDFRWAKLCEDVAPALHGFEANPQHLSNTAWAFAVLLFRD